MIQSGVFEINTSVVWSKIPGTNMLELQQEIRFPNRFNSIPIVDFEIKIPPPTPFITFGYNKTAMVTRESFFVRIQVAAGTKLPIQIEIHWTAKD